MKLTERFPDKFFSFPIRSKTIFGTGEDNLFPGYPIGQCTRFLSHRYNNSEINLWPQIYKMKEIVKVKPEESLTDFVTKI
jgi:hypothetical protein